jgi:hypothetical protein
LQQVIIDEDVAPNKTYIYTVTPVYENFTGTPIVLPKIRMDETQSFTPTPPPAITEKEWWEY